MLIIVSFAAAILSHNKEKPHNLVNDFEQHNYLWYSPLDSNLKTEGENLFNI